MLNHLIKKKKKKKVGQHQFEKGENPHTIRKNKQTTNNNKIAIKFTGVVESQRLFRGHKIKGTFKNENLNCKF